MVYQERKNIGEGVKRETETIRMESKCSHVNYYNGVKINIEIHVLKKYCLSTVVTFLNRNNVRNLKDATPGARQGK